MAKLPYMELYVDDYHSATAHLDEREDGIYFRLLRICWQTPGCSIPDDNIWLERKMRMKGKHEDIRAILIEFFTLKNGRWFQKKQMQIFCKTKSKILERKKAGKKGGIAKALKYKDKTPSNTKDLLKQNPSKPLASRTRTISKEKKVNKEKNLGEFYESKRGVKLRGDILERFLVFWKTFSYSKGKAAAADSWLDFAEHGNFDEIIQAAKNEASNRSGLLAKGHTPKMAQGWLSDRRWEDEPVKSEFEQRLEAL